jgi:hypothetical protein
MGVEIHENLRSMARQTLDGNGRPMGEWLKPLEIRGSSKAYVLNFLWRSGRLYVMDNHRAALWCWWQHLDEASKWQLLHIDRHYDCVSSNLDLWLKQLPPREAGLDAHLAYQCRPERSDGYPVIRWDNYMSIFLATDGHRLKQAVFATASEGDPPNLPCLQELDATQLLEFLAKTALADSFRRAPWIVNIDLDYFTARGCLRKGYGELIDTLGHFLVSGLGSGAIGVVTIALSPETTGDWRVAERLMDQLLSGFEDKPDLSEAPLCA